MAAKARGSISSAPSSGTRARSRLEARPTATGMVAGTPPQPDESEHHAMTITFAALGVSPDLVDALEANGITEPFPIQALTIADAHAGHDLCGKAKTGSGKTLAFGLPLLERVAKADPHRPRALVLVPTRELANQVKTVLAPLGKLRDRKVVAVYGGVSMEPQIKSLR